jgi:GntR family transcriptional regulator of abcA and norABC
MKTIISDKEFINLGVKHGVLMMPSSIFGAEKGCFRLTFASQNESSIEKGIRRLGELFTEISSLQK